MKAGPDRNLVLKGKKRDISNGVKIRNLQKRIRPDSRLIRGLIEHVLIGENKKKYEVSVLLVDDLKITRINKKFLGRDYPTDVLAFPIQEGRFSNVTPNLLGDIVISTQTVARNSKRYGTSSKKEFFLCLVHGLLHLIGYKDDTKKNRLIMQNRQQFHLRHFKGNLNSAPRKAPFFRAGMEGLC